MDNAIRFNMKSFYKSYDLGEGTINKFRFHKLISENYSESNDLDFKEMLPSYDKLVKHILAFANSGGDALLIGVDDSGNPVGLSDMVDPTELKRKINKWIPSHFIDYSPEIINFPVISGYELSGKSFIAIFVAEQYEKSLS